MLRKSQQSKKGINIIYLMSLYFPSHSKRFFVLFKHWNQPQISNHQEPDTKSKTYYFRRRT